MIFNALNLQSVLEVISNCLNVLLSDFLHRGKEIMQLLYLRLYTSLHLLSFILFVQIKVELFDLANFGFELVLDRINSIMDFFDPVFCSSLLSFL